MSSVGDWISDLLGQLGEVPELIAGIIMIVIVWLMGMSLEPIYPGAAGCL